MSTDDHIDGIDEKPIDDNHPLPTATPTETFEFEAISADGSVDLDSKSEDFAPTEDSSVTTTTSVVSMTLDDVIAQISDLKQSFEQKIRYDASREAIIDRLHGELQEYKADLLMKMIKPLALGMIRMHDDLGQMIEGHPDDEGQSESTRKLLKLLVNLRDDIEDLLNVNGVQAFSVEGSSEFDPKQQRVLNRVGTSDPQLDRHIAQRLRKGFIFNERVIRPEIVAVYVSE